MATTKKGLHLSVRKTREYARLMKEQKEIAERVRALEVIGTANDSELLDKSAAAIGKVLSALPESLMRKAMHLAAVTFIPKSPRGRKPTKHAQAA